MSPGFPVARPRMAPFAACLAFLALLPQLSRASAAPGDSLEARLGRIRGILGDLQRELDTLEQAVRIRAGAGRDSAVPGTPDSAAPAGIARRPLAADLLTGRARTLAEAAATTMETAALGYTLDPLPGIGMHFHRWGKAWGFRAAASARFHETARSGGADLQAMRVLHRFSLFGALHTRLYALAGLGALWRREPYSPYSGPPGPTRTDRAWHGTADLPVRAVLGAGSEIGLLSLGGIRMAPEIGFQAAQYLQRYQDSPSWREGGMAFPGEARPKSDFALQPYLALQVSIYLR